MTRRPLTIRELQQCVAPGDAHMIDDGVTFMVDEETVNRQLTFYAEGLAHQQPRGYALDIPSCAYGTSFQTYLENRLSEDAMATHPLPDYARTLPDYARTVVELPRPRKPCGRLCILVQFMLWVVAFSGAGATFLGILAWWMGLL